MMKGGGGGALARMLGNNDGVPTLVWQAFTRKDKGAKKTICSAKYFLNDPYVKTAY